MRILNYLSMGILLFVFACQSPKAKETTETVEVEVKEPELPESYLMHDVYLNLVDSMTADVRQMVLDQLHRLESLPEPIWLHVGERANTGDPRLDANYDLALHVVFANEEALKTYSVNTTHLEVRENIKAFLAAPPVVYDYLVSEGSKH
ncbi:hypothetical protein GC194_12780 [bacterium]|nr:hypothetical protein [bacterium]